MKKLYVAFLLGSAIMLGHYLGNAVVGTEGLSWLSFGKAFGFGPTCITFGGVIEFTIGFMFTMNIAQVFLIVTAIIIYTKTAPKIFK